jgi:hypothetical protein
VTFPHHHHAQGGGAGGGGAGQAQAQRARVLVSSTLDEASGEGDWLLADGLNLKGPNRLRA